MKPISKSLGSAALLLVVAVMVAAGCQRATAPPPPPPPAVTVSQPLEREVVRWNDYSSYLASPETVNVKARISGLIEEAPFHEGALIHKGDLLFKIDPRPFQADLDNKKAAVAQATATVDQTRVHYQRYITLSRLQVISHRGSRQRQGGLRGGGRLAERGRGRAGNFAPQPGMD